MAWTGPLCASSFACGSGELGDQRVTVPLAWPQLMMAVCGFCAMASQAPSLVRSSHTIWPVEVSWYFR
jgi:hypothetical protein